MRYIFLLFCAIGWQVLPASVIYAQTDTLMLELKNIPVLPCTDFEQYGNPPGHFCDSVKPFSRKLSFYFNSKSSNNDTIIYLRDTSYPTKVNNGNISETDKLTVVYDTTDRILKTIKLTTSSVDNEEIYLNYLPASESEVTFSMDIIPMQRNGRILSAFFSGLEILQHNFHYDDYSRSNQYSETGSVVGYNGSTDTSTEAITDSSSISINLSTMALLGVNSTPILHEENLSIYPNPASNAIWVNISNQEKFIEFCDVLGREWHIPTISKTDSQWNFDISSLPPGIYYLRAGNQMQKFVIQR